MKWSLLVAAPLVVGAVFVARAAPTTASKAPQPVAVQLSVRQFLLHPVSKGGKTSEERIAAPSAALPSSVLLEEITARNVSAKPQKGVVVKVAVPAGTSYHSLSPASSPRWQAQFSADGGKTYQAAPLRRSEVRGGKTVKLVVKPTAYTHVRWIISELKGNEALKMAFRVKVKSF